MTTAEQALEMAREIVARGVEPECAENTARVLAAGILALSAEVEAPGFERAAAGSKERA